MVDLDGETAIVTGAAQGFGRRIAHRLGEAGANVVIADVQNEKAEEVSEELDEKNIPNQVAICDVTDPDAVDQMIDDTVDRFGSIEMLVNNAGGAGSEHTADLELEDWKWIVELNLTGPFICTKAVAEAMSEHGNGRVVNISSMAGRNVTVHGNAAYTSSKWGLLGLTKHTARDFGPDVRVNAICPGGGPSGPLEKPLEASDVADAVLLLVSDLSGFINGTIVEVDGGGHINSRPDYLDKPPEEWPDFIREQDEN